VIAMMILIADEIEINFAENVMILVEIGVITTEVVVVVGNGMMEGEYRLTFLFDKDDLS
jgi:hypothetical protein